MNTYQDSSELGFGEAIKLSTHRLFQFEGRSRRSEFWWTVLVAELLSLVLTPFAGWIVQLLLIPLTFRRLHDTGRSGWWWALRFVLSAALMVMVVVDVVTVVVGEGSIDFDSATYWLQLVGRYAVFGLVVLVYRVLFLVFLCQDSKPGRNRYGDSPKYPEQVAV